MSGPDRTDPAAVARAIEELVAGGADTDNALRMLAWAAERGYGEATLHEMVRMLVLARQRGEVAR